MVIRGLTVNRIDVSGNYHVDRDEVLREMGLKRGTSLVKLEFDDITNRLLENPWIKKVSIRKNYPHSLVVRLKEAEPRALLKVKKDLYLIDSDGVRLEKIGRDTTPFLPVISGINPKNRKGIHEAIKLVSVITDKQGMTDRNSIEVGIASFGLTVKVDGEFIKVGYGKYNEKLDRWLELEPEIRRRGVPIKYVDLRFKDSVIVKPLHEPERKAS